MFVLLTVAFFDHQRIKMVNAVPPPFKTCPMCATEWATMETFLADSDLSYNGYLVDFDILEQGLFYFTHGTKQCGSTMIIIADKFFRLNNEERYTEDKSGTEECPGYCADKNQLDSCDNKCEFAFARQVSQIIKDRMTNSKP